MKPMGDGRRDTGALGISVLLQLRHPALRGDLRRGAHSAARSGQRDERGVFGHHRAPCAAPRSMLRPFLARAPAPQHACATAAAHQGDKTVGEDDPNERTAARRLAEAYGGTRSPSRFRHRPPPSPSSECDGAADRRPRRPKRPRAVRRRARRTDAPNPGPAPSAAVSRSVEPSSPRRLGPELPRSDGARRRRPRRAALALPRCGRARGSR